MSLSRPFILRPIATSLVMVAILLAGIVAYNLLPISALPEVDYPIIRVSAFFPGASPEVMVSSVTAPLERQFGQIPGLDQMTSISSNGAMNITLQFSLASSLDDSEQEVQAAINAATSFLPAELPNPPVYNKVNPADAPILTLALTSPTLPLPQVEDIADTRFAQKIAQTPGVGLVSMSGGQRPAVRIQVNPTTLAAYGLTLEDVRTAIVAANANAAKGSFDGPLQASTINANDQLLTSAEYKDLIIAYKNNAPIRLQDVALASDDVENNQLAAWVNQTPAILLNIQKQPGANVIAVVDRIKALLPQLQAALPKAIQLSILTDRTETIRASVKDAQAELLLSIALVILIIFIFLRKISATLIPSFSVPLSLIGTFAVMYLAGFSLNNLTLMALTVATGFVVDDAIVMIENITRFMEQGESPLQAALKGAGQIGFTILSLTISLLAALIPLLFMQDLIGRLFREFAMTLGVAILISAFVSLTLTPMLCAKILRHEQGRQSRFEKNSEKIQNAILNRYSRSLQWVLGHQGLTLFIFLITLIFALLSLYFIPKGFFPLEDTGVIQGMTFAPQSISFPEMARRQQMVVKQIIRDPAIANVASFIGVDGTNMTLNNGRLQITLKPLSQRDDMATVLHRIQNQINAIPGMTLFMQPLQDLVIDDRVTATQYQYSMTSPDPAAVAQWSDALVQKLRNDPILKDVASDQQNLGLQTLININRDSASQLGVSMQAIDNTLYDAFGQRQIATLFTEINQYHVILEVLPQWQLDNTALNNLFFTNSNGKPIPITTFTQISTGTTPLAITRQGQFPVATLSFNLAAGASLGAAIRAINQAATDLNIPASVQTSFEGAARVFQNSLQNEGWLILAAIVAVYIILGVLYESYIHPVTILSTLPSAALGALLALWLTNNNLTVIAVIGIILLIGIVMKNAILMIDFALELERYQHKSPVDAIYEACLLRFRPILMTTIVAMLGALPLALGTGMGSELRRPLGIVIIAGLIVSQLLTLYSTPVIYLTFDRWAKAVSPYKSDLKTE